MDIYQEAYLQKRKEEFNQIDVMAWLNGKYMVAAISSCFSKKSKYPELPQYSSKNIEKNEGISDELKDEIAAKKFEAFAEKFNKKLESKSK